MRRNRFVETANVQRFLAGIKAVEERGAQEACICLVQGDAGHGKSNTGAWWGVKNDATFVRLKARPTPHWVLADLAFELQIVDPQRSREKLFAQIMTVLAKEQRPIVIDEAESALHDIAVLETLRDLTDLANVPLVLLGREYLLQRLQRHAHIRSRISSVVTFGPIDAGDVRRCFDEMCELPVADDLINAVTDQSEGRIREVLNAIANIERWAGKRKGAGPVSVADLGQRHLTRDVQSRRFPQAA